MYGRLIMEERGQAFVRHTENLKLISTFPKLYAMHFKIYTIILISTGTISSISSFIQHSLYIVVLGKFFWQIMHSFKVIE